jgi:hypothetical protein
MTADDRCQVGAALVFKDGAGEYYVLSAAALQQARVPAEQKGEVERLVAQSADGTAGYAWNAAGMTPPELIYWGEFLVRQGDVSGVTLIQSGLDGLARGWPARGGAGR